MKRSTKQVMRDTLKGKYDCDFALTQILLSLLFPGYAVIARGIVLSASSRGWGAPQLAYVAGAAHGISIIDIARQRVTGTMTIAGNPRTVLLNPDGHALYVTQPMLGRVAVISAKTGKTLCTASLPGQPSLLALSLDATVLYAAGQGDTSVRALLVANGHHWDPRWPEPPFPGHFDGDSIHSHYYKEPDPYIDKRVLVLGFGNSAMDIAVETSRVSKMTFLSVRRGFHVIPKYIMGKPLDQLPTPRFLPYEWQLQIYRATVRMQIGKLTDYGLPEPDHKIGQAHPTISSDIFNRIAHGCIKIKPNIRELDGDGVIFSDGSREKIDSIIYCTGYKITFPFFAPDLIEAKNNDLALFRRVFHPRYRDLFFIGLLQPLGAIMPLAEVQSIWISKYLLGEYTLPAEKELLQDIYRERTQMRKRYGNSPRHTMQVDFAPYIASVQKEMKRGAKRSAPLIQKEQPAAEPVAEDAKII